MHTDSTVEPKTNLRWLRPLLVLVLAAFLGATAAEAQPTFSKVFAPDTIGPGSVSTLTFTITNGAGVAVDMMDFTDNLPAGVTIATPANVVSDCGGTVTAPDGGGTITLVDGGVGGFGSCTVSVDVTSGTPGTHMNDAGVLSSSAGNSPAAATDDLTVATDRPGFTKSFSPSSVPLGNRSTLTFTIDNSANGSVAANLTFTDNLPVGMEVADPANASTTCTSGVVTAVPGSGVISHGGAFVAAGGTCTISVDVVATGVGALGNSSGELLSNAGMGPLDSSGKANATLTVTAAEIALIKEFLGDPVPPGGTVDLQFTILNLTRFDPATNLSFTDDLNATLAGLAATGPPTPDPPCGAGSSLSLANPISLTGGNVAPQGSCTFTVTLQVPAGAATGAYPNTTTALNGDVGGGAVIANQASDILFLSPAPILTKIFMPDTVAAGGTTTLELTITNTSLTSAATDIAFTDVFDIILPSSPGPPPVTDCPGGSASFTPLINPPPPSGVIPAQLDFSGGSLAAGASCTVSVTLDVDPGAAVGAYLNTTSEIIATVDSETVVGMPATDTLNVVAGPSLIKLFTNDPVLPGGTVTLEFTLTHDALAPADATGISFSDDLNATLSGLVSISPTQNDVCGAGSQITGTSPLSFTGGTLAPGDSCTFSVTLQVPAGNVSGIHTNTTSTVGATVSGLATTSNAATDDLVVTGFVVTKSFTDDPALPGGTVTLEFTLDNTSGTVDAANVFFEDDLDSTLNNMAALVIPAAPCGGTLVGLASNTFLRFSGATVTAGASCSFSVTLQVPAGAVDGFYSNATERTRADLPALVLLPPATDTLIVAGNPLLLSKSFTDDPVAPGGTVTLEFTLTNTALQAATDLAFSDDLGATLFGLAATDLPKPACGGTLSNVPTPITLSGASLGAGASCMFSATLAVPAAAPAGTYINTTGPVTGLIGGLPVNGDPASDDLRVEALTFTKAFDGPTVAGGSPVLTFTIENQDAASGVTDISFTDDLEAVVTGLVATGLPMNDVCGPGSQLTGTSFLTLTGGNLGPSGNCLIFVTLQVPAAAAPGTYPNTTSDLFLAGLSVAAAATADLTIVPPPAFSKSFTPAAIAAGAVSTLAFTIDNTASVLAASSLDFTDNLPAGMTVASPPNASTTCSGGILTAVAGTGVVSYTGGTVAGLVSCTASIDVTANVPGALLNTTGNLTSSSGTSGTAGATLTVAAPGAPVFSKVFAPATVPLGAVSTLTFTIDNTLNLIPATNLDFTDNLPAGITVANPPNASTTCTGGTLTAVTGTGVVSYTGGTVAASTSCGVQVDVVSSVDGILVNTSADLTSSAGSSGMAIATLTILPPIPDFSLSFVPGSIVEGGISALTYTIDNTTGPSAASALDFANVLPAGVVISTPANASTSCTGGTLTAPDGGGTVTYTGGTVGAGAICTVQVDATSGVAGVYDNTTGDLTSSAGNSGPASGRLIVGSLIPTLDEWGLILFVSLLALFAFRAMRTTRRVSS